MVKAKAAVLGLVVGAVAGTFVGFMYGAASQTVDLGPQHLIGGAVVGAVAGWLLGYWLGY